MVISKIYLLADEVMKILEEEFEGTTGQFH